MSIAAREDPQRERLRAHRKVFWDAWMRARRGLPLDALQTRIAQVIGEHPEYHHLFADEEAFLDQDADFNGCNPWLHLSLHLAIEEQLALAQPPALRQWLQYAQNRRGMDRHAAIHAAMEVLGEVMADAQRRGGEPDVSDYARRIEALTRR